MDTITFTMSGRAWCTAMDGNWQVDCPSGGAALRAAESSKAGTGRRYRVTMAAADARDLAAYLDGLASLWRNLTAQERGTDDPRPLEAAAAAIGQALVSGQPSLVVDRADRG